MKLNTLIKSNYLKVEDLAGEPIVFTIKKLTLERIGNPPADKSVVWFDESTQGLVCNKTNL